MTTTNLPRALQIAEPKYSKNYRRADYDGAKCQTKDCPGTPRSDGYCISCYARRRRRAA